MAYTIEEAIVKETGKTFDEIRAMSDIELYDFIEDIRQNGYDNGFDEAKMPIFY